MNTDFSVFPQDQESAAPAPNARYRTFWRRFWAGIVDSLVFVPLIAVDFWLEDRLTSPVLLTLWLVAYTMCYEVYSVAMHARYGQTLGKMAMRIKVLDVSEGRLSLRQALLRDSVPIVLSVMSLLDGASDATDWNVWMMLAAMGSLLWFGAELLTMLTNPKRRAIHDFIAGSVVVRTDGTP